MKFVKVSSDQQLEDALYVRKKVFVDEQHVPVEIEIDEFENEATHFVLYDGNQPIGAGRLRVINHKGKVERICVLKSHRSTGAGRKIMSGIEHFASNLNIHTFILNAQTSAIPFYEKLGYSVISDKEFLDAGIPHKAMEKQLNEYKPWNN